MYVLTYDVATEHYTHLGLINAYQHKPTADEILWDLNNGTNFTSEFHGVTLQTANQISEEGVGCGGGVFFNLDEVR